MSRIAVIVALSAERASLGALSTVEGLRIDLLQCGPGAERAGNAALGAIARGASALISWGYAGGLDPALGAGTITVPPRVLDARGNAATSDPLWRELVADVLGAELEIAEGDLLTAAHVLGSAAEKSSARAASGATAVDMESAAIARAASEASLPFIAVRAIVDTAADSLPANAEDWIDSAGAQRLAPLAGVLLRPGQWGVLARLGSRQRRAARSLERAASLLAREAFCFPQLRGAVT